MAKLSTSRLDRVHKSVGASVNEMKKIDENQEKIESFLKMRGLPGEGDQLIEIDPMLISTDQNLAGRTIDKSTEKYKSFLLSIETDGLLQPPTIYLHEGKIVCKFGNHRVEACKDLKHKTIRCIFLSAKHVSDDIDSAEDDDRKFMENHQSKKNSPLVYASWVKRKVDMGLANDQIAKRLGKDREWVRRYFKISEWPDSAKDYIKNFESHFNQSFLHGLAKRSSIKEQDLLQILREKVTGKEEKKLPTRKGAEAAISTKKSSLVSAFDELCKKDTEIGQHRELVKKALMELRLI